MKKLVAISVLFAGLAAAVFAQDEGKWKVGFMARYVTDMLYAASATKSTEDSETSTFPGDTPSKKTVTEFGKYNKGSVDFFGNHALLPHPDYRVLLSLSNSGENYDVYADIKWDNDWANVNDTNVLSFLSKDSADWYAKGTAGIFNAQVGTAGYEGWVSTQATWNDWLGWNQLCRFGVWRPDVKDYDLATSGFIASDNFRTWSEWGSIFALGAGLGDNFKLSLGYRLNPDWGQWSGGATDPWGSKSSINGSFLFSGRASVLTFDLFYAVKGKDPETKWRHVDSPDGTWENILGAYIGLGIVDNLGLSLGYTANFEAHDTAAFKPKDDATGNQINYKPRTFTAPFYSGIDLRVSFSGIDKIGLTFNNNISLAGVKGIKYEGDYDNVVLGFDGKTPVGDGESYDWFHWNSELKATFALVENLGLTLHLGDQLGVVSSAYDRTDPATATNPAVNYTGTGKLTKNEFRVAVTAEYGIGSVTIGTGLFLGIESTKTESEDKIASGGFTDTKTSKSDTSVTKFGIPVFFRVAF